MTIQDSEKWDGFIAQQAYYAGLTQAEKRAFELRFSARLLEDYKKGHSEQKTFQKVIPSHEMSWQAYTRQRSEFFKKFSLKGWNQPKRNKSESLLLWLEGKLQSFEGVVSPQDYLKSCLATLDYRSQRNTFEDFLETCEPAGAFVVQGQIGSCQRWLIDRLVHRYLPGISPKHKISINPPNDEVYVEDLWKQLGDRLLRNQDVTPAGLVEYIYQLWKEDSVILVFHDLGDLPESEPKKIIRELWNPLMAKVRQDEGDDGFNLLLFLVHNWGEADSWGLKTTSDMSNWDCLQPIELPAINKFEIKDVQPWISKHRDLPNLLPKSLKPRQVAEELLKRGRGGVPDRTMAAICKRCGSSWEKIENSLDFL